MTKPFAFPVFSVVAPGETSQDRSRNLSSAGENDYLKALGFRLHPFPVAPDEAHFFVSGHIERIVAEIVHGILARKGFMALSGDVGLGKTTISRRIIAILADKGVDTALVFHTSLKDQDLLREINRDFGLIHEAATGLGDALRALNEFLMGRYRKGGNCAIIIDDAQNLDRDSLELVRMISNLEADGCKLVQVLLVGQPELMDHLDTPGLRQLKSRIFIDTSVRPLTREELRTYIVFKLSLADNPGRITLSESAYRLIYRYTGGNLRRINMLMDRCLYAVCRRHSALVDARAVRLAQTDMQPRSRRFRWRLPALAAAALLPLFVGTTVWLHQKYAMDVSQEDTKRAELLSVAPVIDPAAAKQLKNIEKTPDGGTVNQSSDKAVKQFLEAYGLFGRTEEFKQAHRQGHISVWAEAVFHETGLQLVCLHDIPFEIRGRYGALHMASLDGAQSGWYLFWRPNLKIDHFYYGYASDQIQRLQTLLAASNDYRSKLDGVVGPRLMKALVAFQTRAGLSVTGAPDAETLFLLSHQKGELS